MTKILTGLFLLTTLNCFSQTLHDEINNTYDFSPGKLTKEEQEKKIPLMDAFWARVKSDTSKYLNELRRELRSEGNPKFFYYEGGQLLLSISKNINDKEIILKAIIKSDLADVDRRSLVGTLNYLAKSNLNTTEVAIKILDDKAFKFFLPEHSFYFNQGYCLTYSLLPTSPDFYLTAVIDRFKSEKDLNAKKSIVTLLWFTNSCKGNEFLRGLSADKATEKEVTD